MLVTEIEDGGNVLDFFKDIRSFVIFLLCFIISALIFNILLKIDHQKISFQEMLLLTPFGFMGSFSSVYSVKPAKFSIIHKNGDTLKLQIFVDQYCMNISSCHLLQKNGETLFLPKNIFLTSWPQNFLKQESLGTKLLSLGLF